MDRTVHFYCGGTKPLIELFVALYTLRQHYSGHITVCLGQTSMPIVGDIIKKSGYDIDVFEVPDSSKDKKVEQHWSSRWRGMKQIQKKQVLHLDCDITVKRPIDHCFDHIHPDSTYMTSFYMWNPDEKYWLWDSHLGIYRGVDPNLPLDTKPLYLGFGLIGFHNTWPHFQEMSDLCLKISKDELCMNYVLLHNGRKGYKPDIQNPIKTARAYYRLREHEFYDTDIWHFSGGGPLGYYMWWKDFLEMREKGIFNMNNDDFFKLINNQAFKLYQSNTYPSTNNIGKGAPK